MPTFNQLVRSGRETVEKKAKSPALLKKQLNNFKTSPINQGELFVIYNAKKRKK